MGKRARFVIILATLTEHALSQSVGPLAWLRGSSILFFPSLIMRVDILALGDVFDLGLSAVLDAFQTANELIELSELTVPRFEVRIVGVRKTVKTSQGLTVPVQGVGARPPDCVVVPAIGFQMPEPLEKALARPDVRDA